MADGLVDVASEMERLRSETHAARKAAQYVGDNSTHWCAVQVVAAARHLNDRQKQTLIEAIETGITSDLWKVFG